MEIESLVISVNSWTDGIWNKESLLKMEIESYLILYLSAQVEPSGNKESLLKMEIESDLSNVREVIHRLGNKESLLKMEIERSPRLEF